MGAPSPSNALHPEEKIVTMALSEKSRSSLYQALTQTVDEEAVAEMLAHFPARDVEEPVTREHLDRRLAELSEGLRVEIAGLRGELRTEVGGLRGELRTEVGGLRGELQAEISGLRGELQAEISGLRGELQAELSGLRGELQAEISGLRGELRTEVGGLRGELHTGLAEVREQIAATANRTIIWLVATIVAMSGLVITASAGFSG